MGEVGAKTNFRRRESNLLLLGMNCFVTGASGFIGANLVHELIARGHRVKALLREKSDLRGLAGASFERVEGDVTQAGSLKSGMKGCDWCFHVAASYHLWLRDYAPMYAANVEGTRAVIEAAAAAGCSRIVYTSTVGCIGLPEMKGERLVPTDESAPVSEAQMSNHYKRSKWQAEQVALELARKGLPVVIVNPSAPVGPRDVKPTPTGQVIVDFLNRAMPAYLDTGLSWVHVRDVVIGHILAAEKGRAGERYILGNADGNWTMHEAFSVLQEITGLSAPKVRIPYFVALAAAHVDEAVSNLTGKPPKAPLAGVRMAKYKMFFNPAKAIRELGLPQTSPKQALADAVRWFSENGYVKKGRQVLSTALFLVMLPSFLSATGAEPSPALSHAQIYERAGSRFEEAVLFKPTERTTNGLTFRLAPLIMQDAKEHRVRPGDTFGAVVPTGDGLKIDSSRPKIYVHTDTVDVGKKTKLRFTYLWFYAEEASPGSQPASTCQGVRITLDATGNPAIWEILTDDSRNELIFVSKSLESLAAGEFGKPLPQRRYAIERSLDEAPTTVVPRVIEDGPVPMGPIIYLEAKTRSVSTLICRCMPVQAQDLVATRTYELVPYLEDGAGVLESFSRRCGEIAFWPGGKLKNVPLEKRLRRPSAF
jgi:dihydroflavonol-4-reductase